MEYKHWSATDIERLNQAKDFEEVAEIAIAVLAAMEKPVVQVCGPLSTGGFGNMEKNVEVYQKAVAILEQKGYTVADPGILQERIEALGTHDPANGKYDYRILDTLFDRIYRSGHISEYFFIPGWETSEGATWERKLHEELGHKVSDMPKEWFGPIFADER